jgi:hypothetical protein
MVLARRMVLGCVGLVRVEFSRGEVRRQSPAFLIEEKGTVR